MKKLFRLLLLPALAVGLITSCSTDHQNDLGYGKDHKLNAQFTAGIASSRVTGNNWDKEDVIGIYAVNSGQELADDAIYKGNSKYTTVSEAGTGDFSPASDNDAIIFEKEGNKLDFIAYYPYQATVTDYKLAIDVSDQSKLSKIDYLYSNNAKGHNRENKEVPLQFKHQLTQLVLNITGDSDLGDLANLKLAAEGFIPTGSLNLKDGVVTVEGTDAKILNLTGTKTDAGVTMRAIVLPGQNMKNTSFVFDLNGMKFKAWIPEDLVLESNARVTYKVELSTDGSVLASPTGTIEDWTDVEGGEVILEPETENDVIIIDDADKELSFDANAAEKIVNVKAPESLAWTASTAETWITLENAEAIGTADLKIKLEANTGVAREGVVKVAPKANSRTETVIDTVVVIVKQEGEVAVEGKVYFEENFGTTGNKDKVSSYTGWQNGEGSGITFLDETGNADVRSLDKVNSNVWFPANNKSELQIQGINIADSKNLVLEFKYLANAFSKGEVSNLKALTVYVNGVELDLPSVKLTDNKFKTAVLDLTKASIDSDKLDLKFYLLDTKNQLGFRIDDVVVKEKDENTIFTESENYTEDIFSLNTESLAFEASGGEKEIEITTADGIVELKIETSAEWLSFDAITEITQLIKYGDTKLSVVAQSNSGEERIAVVKVVSTDPALTKEIKVTQPGGGASIETFYSETFGDEDPKKVAIDQYTGYDDKKAQYSAEGEKINVRKTSSLDNHVWIPAAVDGGGLIIEGIDTSGGKNLTFSLDYTYNGNITAEEDAIKILIDGVEIEYQRVDVSSTNYNTYIIENIPSKTNLKIEIRKNVSEQGYRIDNLLIQGEK